LSLFACQIHGAETRGRFHLPDVRRGACKPGSVMRAVCFHEWLHTGPARAAIHLGPALPQGSSNQPGRSRGETPLPCAFRPGAPPLFGLAPDGVCHAVAVAGSPVRSYRTLSPLPVPVRAIGGLLSVALSLGFGRAALTDGRFLAGRALPAILVSWSPDFPRTGRPDAAARLPGAGAVNSGKRPAGKRNYRVTPRSRSSSSANSMARISPSTMPSTHSGRNRRWNARTAACPSAMS